MTHKFQALVKTWVQNEKNKNKKEHENIDVVEKRYSFLKYTAASRKYCTNAWNTL